MHWEAANLLDMQLYRLAALVYLSRVAGPILEDEERTRTWCEKAFSIFARMDVCERPFPLLIFGLEAHTDDRRMVLLDLIGKTQKAVPMRNLGSVKAMIQSVWVQYDLAEGGADYVDVLEVVLSSCKNLPLLA